MIYKQPHKFNSNIYSVIILVHEDRNKIVWNIIGDRKIEGIEKFAAELEEMKEEKATELILDQILSHGKEGATNGILKMQNGKKYAFSDFYKFHSAKGAKVKSITSYVIEI